MFVSLTVSILVNKILLETKIPSLIFCFLVYILPYLLTPGPHYEQRLLTAALGVDLPEMWVQSVLILDHGLLSHLKAS